MKSDVWNASTGAEDFEDPNIDWYCLDGTRKPEGFQLSSADNFEVLKTHLI